MAFADATVIGQFTSNPVKFLSENLVVCPYAGSTTRDLSPYDTTQAYLVDEGVKILGLEIYSATHVVARKLGKDVPAYKILPASALGATGGATFQSYVCPYNQSYSFGITISDEADFMVTPTMDGCTFGVGSATASGARLVYHANCGGNKALQANRIQTALPTAKLWDKNDYMEERLGGIYSGFNEYLKSTLVGVRNRASGAWSFHAQVYEWVPQAGGGVSGLPTKVFLRDVRAFPAD